MAQKTVKDDEEGSSGPTRAESGKGAGTSGRGEGKPAKGEDWDQEEFGKGDRKSSCVMVEHPAGSNVWYNGTPLKWTDSDVQFSLGVDNVRSPPSVWVRLTSSRIWRGSLDTKNWKYCSSKNGAWKPRAPAGVRRISASRGRTGSGRKRKVVTEPQDSDYVNGEVTGTTKANQDSDEEMVDTGHCTSPRQANGSDGVHDTGKGSLSGKQEDTGSANPSKAPPSVVKEEGKALAEQQRKPSQANLVYQAWLSRHFRLLEDQGQLNIAPEGCNPEAGRLPGMACADSNRTAEGSLRERETSSSSRSAGLKQEGSHTGRKIQPVSKSGSKPVAALEPPRSPSPSTPSKPVDGSRRERSSSADMDPRSQLVCGSMGNVQPGKPVRGVAEAGSAVQPGIAQQRGGSLQDAGSHGGRKSLGRSQGGLGRINGVSESKGDKPGKDYCSVRQGQGVVKQMKVPKAMAGFKSSTGNFLKPLQTSPSQKRTEAQVATLVETDPFKITDFKKLKAC